MTENKTNTKIKKGFTSGTGRRKTAVARVFVWPEKGDHVINDTNFEDYFPSEKEQNTWLKPFHAIGVSHPSSKFTISVKVEGSGKAAQLDATVHGISRALSKIDEEYSKILRKQGFLTRDPRMVERKKYNKHKARRAHQYSKR
ncbi:30S ribosomal protein S9 [Patescibacteria group bacterium]|nr:30S ribosomal protein S9 [Patescibacteria group bacterium]